MTLSPGANVQPKRSTLRSPAGLRGACNSILMERAPPPPRFIWAQHLDVTKRIEAKALRDARFHQFDDARHSGFRIVRLHEVEITFTIGLGEIGIEPWLILCALVMICFGLLVGT